MKLRSKTHCGRRRAPASPEGGGDRQRDPIYTFPNAHVCTIHPGHAAADFGDAGARRLPQCVFDRKFMDELAAVAGADPVEFRLRHLDDRRGRDVIEKAAQGFGWQKVKKRARSRIRLCLCALQEISRLIAPLPPRWK